MSTQTQYIPTSETPQLVIQSINDFLGTELALPGTWSARVFYNDLKTDPVRDKRELAESVLKACQSDMSYLEFFEKSRGRSKDYNEVQKRLWEIFGRGSVMLYFESLFLKLLGVKEVTPEINVLMLYLDALSQYPINQWNMIVNRLGACCYQFFAKEPELYAGLLYCRNRDIPENMTDEQLLEGIESRLSPTTYRGRISINDSRSILIQKYKSKISP